MESLSVNNKITSTLNQVRERSFREKRNFQDQETIDKFLDKINDLKRLLKEKSTSLKKINQILESITWIDNINDESLKLINDLIAALKDLHSTLIRGYVSLNGIRSKGIAKEEIRLYKHAIDEIKESYVDLESVFFYLPELSGFKETTKELSLI